MAPNRRLAQPPNVTTQIHEFDYLYSLFGSPTRLFAIGGHWSLLVLSVVAIVIVAELGRRREGGRHFFPASCSLFAPLWVGRSNGVQVTVTTASGVQPQDLRVELVDPGTSEADLRPTPRDVASAVEAQPTILTRADWGADESIREGSPSYNATVKVGFVHHTDTANGYSMAEVPAMLRSIYAYHVKSNGWSDIGYNYLVDRFGRLWEGRYGGITKNVLGAHTGGFNTDSFGTSLLGTFTTAVPPDAMLGSLEQLFAWKLGAYYREPLGKATLRSGGGGTSKYAAGVA